MTERRTGSLGDAFDEHIPVGDLDGNQAFFGSDVLRGLVDGIDDFIERRQSRWSRFRSIGPALLGSAMRIDDDDLIDKLGELAGACVVISKQRRRHDGGVSQGLHDLKALNTRTPGMPAAAFASLSGLAPQVGGHPIVVGPSSPIEDWDVPTIRTLGFRGKSGPIIHAKLALLGNLWWHDEDGTEAVTDVIGFEPRRLWISSANFTQASRSSLEFGYWTENPELVESSHRFLVKLMRYSEDVDPDPDGFAPEFAPVTFDDEAFAQYACEMRDEGGMDYPYDP